MLTISIVIPSLPMEWLITLTLALAPLVLLSAFGLASSAAAVLRRLSR